MTPPDDDSTPRTTYASSGVDIDAGERAVDLIKAWVAKTHRPEVVGDLGGFAGLFDISSVKSMSRPLLATSTDGVGTKVAIAQRMDVHNTIGIDLVGMVVDDLVVCGAEPLFMTDYIACGQLIPDRIAAIVSGIAEGARLAGCALVGGETAEHPGLLAVDEYDLAGAGTGVVDADNLLGANRVQAGDVVIAMQSSGLHANGYSLVRHVFFADAGWALDRDVPELGRSLGEELLEPTRIYSLDCLELARAGLVHAFSHITGGGIASNIARVVPSHLSVQIQRASWTPAPIFGLVSEVGAVAREELERTLNMGIGMVAIVPADAVDAACAMLTQRGVPNWVAGGVAIGDGSVSLG
jgi:phosphoribosylformylglycinamidine cyclo-ligase